MHIHVNRLRYFTSNKSTLLHQELFQLAWLKFMKYGSYTLQLKNSTTRPNKLFLLKVAVRINKLCPVCEEPDIDTSVNRQFFTFICGGWNYMLALIRV